MTVGRTDEWCSLRGWLWRWRASTHNNCFLTCGSTVSKSVSGRGFCALAWCCPRAGDIFGRQAGQKQITIPDGGESVMLVQGALPSQGANVEKPWRSVKTSWRSSDGEMTFLPRPAMQIQQRLGMPVVTVLLCPSS